MTCFVTSAGPGAMLLQQGPGAQAAASAPLSSRVGLVVALGAMLLVGVAAATASMRR